MNLLTNQERVQKADDLKQLFQPWASIVLESKPSVSCYDLFISFIKSIVPENYWLQPDNIVKIHNPDALLWRIRPFSYKQYFFSGCDFFLFPRGTDRNYTSLDHYGVFEFFYPSGSEFKTFPILTLADHFHQFLLSKGIRHAVLKIQRNQSRTCILSDSLT